MSCDIWRSALRPIPVGPLPSDEFTMPAQDRLRRDEEDAPGCLGNHADGGREQDAITATKSRSPDLAPHDGELVLKNEKLGLGGHVELGAGKKHSEQSSNYDRGE